jgi:hypothetical protein
METKLRAQPGAVLKDVLTADEREEFTRKMDAARQRRMGPVKRGAI